MDVITFDATPREVGTKASRAIRREGNVPCVLYGHGVDTFAFQVSELSLRPLIYASDLRQVEIKVGKESWSCVPKTIEFHPVTDRPIHVDFQVLRKGEKMTLTVPFRFFGTPIGKREGGIVKTVIHEVDIEVLPKDILSFIEVDISGLAIGDSIHVRDMDFPGIEFLSPEEQTIITVTLPRVEEEPVEEEFEAEEIEEEEPDEE